MNEPILATDEQLSAERTLLTLVADPQIKAAQDALVAEIRAGQGGDSRDAQEQAPRAVRLWTNSLIMRELAADPGRLAILWAIDDSPHSWFGHTVEGTAIAGDNPDHIYRYVGIDGGSSYVIDGWIDPHHPPVQFSVEATHGTPASFGLAQSAKKADMGDQIKMLTDRDVQVDQDGHFRLTVGGPPGGTNHFPTVSGPVSINVRDVLSDWNQRPNRVTIRRTDGAAVTPLTFAELRERVLADLPGYVRFWSGFKIGWLGGLKPNTIVGPVGREGGWGYVAGARFALAPGEAVQITTVRGPARYTGIQVNDPWMVAPDGSRHIASLNNSQVEPDRDGSYTYIVSPEDPGVANWVDTAGLRDGFILLRWQQLPVDAKAEGLLKSFKIIKLKDGIADGLARVTPQQRAAQLAARTTDYAKRLAPAEP